MRHAQRLLLLNKRTLTPAFSPSDITGYAVHFDFSDTSTLYQDSNKTTPVLNDGDVIGAVENKAQAGTYDATQTTTASKPVWRSAGYGESDGVDDVLLFNISTSGWTASTGFIAFRRTDPANVRHMWNVAGSSSSNIWGQSGGRVEDGYLTNTRVTVSSTAGTIGVNHIVTARQDGSALLYRVSGTEVYNAAQTYFLNTGRDSVLFGGTSTAVAPGRIYEVILYDRALSLDEINQVEAYLNNKVGAFA